MPKTGRKGYPLRRILYTQASYGEGIFDYLECGHRLVQSQDMYGTYSPERRRCRKCAKGKEADFKIGGTENESI